MASRVFHPYFRILRRIMKAVFDFGQFLKMNIMGSHCFYVIFHEGQCGIDLAMKEEIKNSGPFLKQ